MNYATKRLSVGHEWLSYFADTFQAIQSKGGHFLEGPVSGSKKPAEDGQLIILAAGEKACAIMIFPSLCLFGFLWHCFASDGQ